MGDTVKPIPFNAVAGCQFMRNGVRRRHGWHGLMKRRIKHTDHRYPFPKPCPRFSDAVEGKRIVNRSEMTQSFQRRQDFLIHNDRVEQGIPAVYETMADGVETRRGQLFTLTKKIENFPHALTVI